MTIKSRGQTGVKCCQCPCYIVTHRLSMSFRKLEDNIELSQREPVIITALVVSFAVLLQSLGALSPT